MAKKKGKKSASPFEVGVSEGLNFLSGKKSMADAASSVMERLSRPKKKKKS